MVIVAREGIDCGKNRLQVYVVVRSVECILAFSVKGVLGRVGVEREIYPGFFQHSHSFVMVLRVINGVYSDRVDSEFLEVLDVARERLDVEQWIRSVRSAT